MPQPDPKEARINTLESQLQKVQIELQQERAKVKINVSEIEEVEARVQKIERNLGNARKKLLSLQPPQHISDDQVKQAFDDLCHNIEDWVDVECQSLTSLEGLFSTDDWTRLEMEMAERHITEDDLELSEEFPNIRSNIVMNAIFSFVYDWCLREERWSVWANANEEMLLNGLVEAMSTQKSTQNAAIAPELQSGLRFTNNPQLRRWRSETVQALENSKYRAHVQQQNLRGSQQKLYFMLKHLADKGTHIQGDKLRSKIIEPAYALAGMIKASTSGYKFDFVVNSSSPDICLKAEDVTQYRIVDVHTGVEEDILENAEGSLGRLRLCVFPALQKVQDSGKRSCMSKALIVLDRSAGTIGEPMAATSEKAKETNEVADVTECSIAPKPDGTMGIEKNESPTDVASEAADKKDAQGSSTAGELTIKHEHVWDYEPQKEQARIAW